MYLHFFRTLSFGPRRSIYLFNAKSVPVLKGIPRCRILGSINPCKTSRRYGLLASSKNRQTSRQTQRLLRRPNWRLRTRRNSVASRATWIAPSCLCRKRLVGQAMQVAFGLAITGTGGHTRCQNRNIISANSFGCDPTPFRRHLR